MPIQSLAGPLADLLDLGLLAKQAHWNVNGPTFRATHLFLDELAALSRDAADTIAERAATLGSSPDGRARTIVEISSLPVLEAGPIRDDDVLTWLGTALDALVARLYAVCEDFENDPVTVDLLTDVLGQLEKQAWILRAQLA